MLGHTYTQVEKGRFVQVQSADDLANFQTLTMSFLTNLMKMTSVT